MPRHGDTLFRRCKLRIAGFDIELKNLSLQNGVVYAMFCEGCGPIEAREVASAVLKESGFEGLIKKACFGLGVSLSRRIEKTMLQSPGGDIVLVLSLDLGSSLEPGRKMTAMALSAFMDVLECEIWPAEFPIILALHTEGLGVNRSLLETECKAREFVRVCIERDEIARRIPGINEREQEAIVAMSGIVDEGVSALREHSERKEAGLNRAEDLGNEVSDE